MLTRTPSHLQDYNCNSATIHDCNHIITNLCLVDPSPIMSHSSSNCGIFALITQVTSP